ncbi:hypothetical protein JCM10212_000254 [Sporobolomyces blumeae]
MSRDRLREARNQQQGYQQQQTQPWSDQLQQPAYGQPQQAYGGGGYGAYQQPYQPPQQQQYAPPPQQSYAPPPPQNAYAHDPYAPPVGQGSNGAYAMQPMNTSGVPQPGGDLGPFFAEVESIQDEIKQLQGNITNVSDLHSRRLASTGDDALQAQTAAQLTQLTNATSGLTNSIRNRITKLNDQNKRSVANDPNFNTRKLQIANLQNSFKRALEEYNLVEKRSRDKYRQRMERQIKIVKPDATQDEIRAAFDDSQGGAQIFSQALMQSRASGARAAFAEVQSRNQDLRKIEETITQLAQMMQDMATLVLEQDESVKMIETQAVQVNTDVEQGLDQTKKAVKSARAARRKRWICFFIILVIIIIALAIGLYYGLLREAYVLTVAGVKAKSSLKDYVPVANEVGAGIIARNRLDTVDFVFRDKEACDRAYAALETGFARYLLTRFAQYNLYIAPRPCARVAFAQMTSLEEAVYDESRRIYLDDAFKPVEYDPLVAAVHAASRTTPRWHDSSDATSSVGRSTASSFVDEPGGSGRGGDDDDDARGPGPGGPAIARAGTSNATSLDSRPSGTW